MKQSGKLSALLIAATLSACSLAGDVTPPPALATQQAIEQQPTTVRPEAVSAGSSTSAGGVPAQAPDPQSGAVIYAESCAPCHGREGLGDGEMAGSLDVPVPALGDPDLAAFVAPGEWYDVVTEGRMERFMPPFQSLSDSERWDVVSHALGLSVSPNQMEQGEFLYQQACENCHGIDGLGGEVEVDLTSLEGYAERSLIDLVSLIDEGSGEMPGFGEQFDEGELRSLAGYARSLATRSVSQRPLEPETASDAETQSGALHISVSNGTEGGSVPEGIEVNILAFDGEEQVLQEIIPIDSQGQASLEGIEISPGRIFGAFVDYQGVQYFSSGGHLLAEDPQLELELTIYESTPDIDLIKVERLHLIFDYTIEGIVEVSELWIIRNSSDRTIAQLGGSGSMPVALPEGFGGLRFESELVSSRVTVNEQGFTYHEPILPGTPQELIFTFTLPYTRSLEFIQPIDYPVDAVVLLAEEGAPELTGSGLIDGGTRQLGELALRTYTIDALEPGSTLALQFRGRHPAGSSGISTTNLLIGAGVLVLTVALVLFVWQTWTARSDMEPVGAVNVARQTRTSLLQAIAGLDDAYEGGEIEESIYEEQRASLKRELIELIAQEDD